MNKKPVFRFFDLRHTQPDEETNEVFTELVMSSLLEGPYGSIKIETGIRLDGVYIWQTMIQDSGSPAELTFLARCGEMHYFIHHIVPLFNPVNSTNYETSSSQESPEF